MLMLCYDCEWEALPSIILCLEGSKLEPNKANL